MTDSTAEISLIEGTSNFSVIVTSGSDSIIEIYENNGSFFNLNQAITKPYGINQIKISET